MQTLCTFEMDMKWPGKAPEAEPEMQGKAQMQTIGKTGTSVPLLRPGRRMGCVWADVGEYALVDLKEGGCGSWTVSTSCMKYMAGSFPIS